MLLELVVERIGRGAPRTIPGLKFQRSLSPGQTFTLRWNADDDRVNFRCSIGDESVAEGVLEYGETA